MIFGCQEKHSGKQISYEWKKVVTSIDDPDQSLLLKKYRHIANIFETLPHADSMI